MSTCHLLCPWSWVVTLDLHYLRQPGNIQSRQGANTGDQTYLVFNPETKWRDLTNTLEVGASSASSDRSTAEHLESLYQQQAHMIRVLQAPKFNLPVFVWDPVPLIRAFEDSMERTLPDNSFCFTHLVQLCTGYAASHQLLHPNASRPRVPECPSPTQAVVRRWIRVLLVMGEETPEQWSTTWCLDAPTV